jgi:hypothetical protein
VAIPNAADGYEDGTTSILPGGSRVVNNHKPSALVSASDQLGPCLPLMTTPKALMILASVIGGERPLLGMGGGIRQVVSISSTLGANRLPVDFRSYELEVAVSLRQEHSNSVAQESIHLGS